VSERGTFGTCLAKEVMRASEPVGTAARSRGLPRRPRELAERADGHGGDRGELSKWRGSERSGRSGGYGSVVTWPVKEVM
jgi:hypothetical protein